MIVWPAYRLAYLAMPATGSHAVSAALRQAGAIRIGGHHDTPADHAERLRSLGYGDDWVVATTIRRIVDWFSSMWRKGVCDSANMEAVTIDWVRDFEQDRTYFPEDGSGPFWQYVPWSNVVWRYETLQSDINSTLAKLGAPSLRLEVLNPSHRGIVSWESSALEYVGRRYGRTHHIPRRRPDLHVGV